MIVGIVFFGIGVGHFVIDGPVAGESLAAQRIGLDLAGLFALADFDVCFGEVEVVEVAVNADTFFGEVAELELVADFVVRVFVDQCAQVELSVLGHAVVDIEDEADALARQVVPAHFIIIVRNESVQVVVEAPAASFVVMGLNAEALIVDGGRNAELVAKHVGIGQRGFRGDVFGQLIVGAFDLGADELAVAVKGGDGLEVDDAADCVGIDIRGQGFLDFDTVQKVRWHTIQQDAAAIFRRRRAHAVDGG